ncbi:MAG: hypothetical protein WCD50_01365 [Onishia taeanensis]|uniref:hypothetical protein n=1 Tax=Onishia taeanensis TaxID=284577 RepID=UPI003C7AA708
MPPHSPSPSADANRPSVPTSAKISGRQRLAGLVIALGLALQIVRLAGVSNVAPLVGVAFWLAITLLWADMPTRNRRQVGALAVIGAALLVISQAVYGEALAWGQVLDGNTFVVAMLVGVSFIGLINRAPPSPGTQILGGRGVITTWLSVHLLGAILNLSSVFLIGDQLKRDDGLRLPQLLTLNRGLSSAALWSPFFAAMGVAIGLAPKLDFAVVLAAGVPLAALSGVLTRLELARRFDLDDVAGVSLSPRNLLMPVGLAVLVLGFHYGLTPGLSIVSIITFLLPATALAANLPHGLTFTSKRMVQHTRERLPAMRGEISLFLAAGLFTQGLSTFIDAVTGGQWVLFEHFGAGEAMLSYLAIVASAVIGLHPIIGISTLASVLNLESANQTLLGVVALSAWAVGAAIGPLSGINLSLQGRYGTSGGMMMRHNLVYALVMSLGVCLAIGLLAALG